MKHVKNKEKQIIKDILAKLLKELRGSKSMSKTGSEYGISPSIISLLERGLKDPSLTTLFRVAEALEIKLSDLIAMIEEELPEWFTMCE